MTIHLNLSPEQQARLEAEATAKHLPVDEYVGSLVTTAIAKPNEGLLALLDSWEAEDATTDENELAARDSDLESLKQGLDASRLSSRKLFT